MAKDILETKNLRKSYGKKEVVKGLDLQFSSDKIIGLLGPNGAGKTTTFYMIVGLIPPNSGEIFLNGNSLTNLPMYERARAGIAYLPQEPSVFRNLSVLDNLLAVLEFYPMTQKERIEKAMAALESLGITHIKDTLGYALSGGERRRTEIARALILSPKFFLLDEPFAGIDPLAVLDIQKIIVMLKEQGLGVVITDHNVRETLKITDEAYMISEGTLFRHGTPKELAEDDEVKRTYLGEGFTLN
ncbi:MAG: LPS export ABC transporter ATP-binding protein [Acidobacteriota bacterium]